MINNFEQELEELRTESIGWIPLKDGAYLHISIEGNQEYVVITGQADTGLCGENVLLLV